MSETLSYATDDALFEGVVFAPSRADLAPGIILFGDVFGRSPMLERRARMMADLGYVALAADLYGGGAFAADRNEAITLAKPLIDNPARLRLRARAAFEALAGDVRVDRGRVALLGYCFGGTAALEAARDGCPAAAALSFHGGLATAAPAGPDAVAASLLVLTGGDDPLVPPAQVATFEDEMRAAGADWQVVSFGGAKHAFTVAEADTFGIPGVGYDARADTRSWRIATGFLEETFAGNAQ